MTPPRTPDEFASYYRRPEIASAYDEQRSRSLKHSIVRQLEKRLFQAGISPSGTALEVGIGTGEIAELVCASVPLLGIDTSAEMLSRAKSRLPADRVRLLEMSMFDLSSLTERFTTIYSSRVFLHLHRDDLRRMLALCADRLESGGTLIFDLQRPNVAKAVLDRFESSKVHNFRYTRSEVEAVIRDEPRLRVREICAFEHMALLGAAALLPNWTPLKPLAALLVGADRALAHAPLTANRWGVTCERI